MLLLVLQFCFSLHHPSLLLLLLMLLPCTAA
jgi:hypothetical protein